MKNQILELKQYIKFPGQQMLALKIIHYADEVIPDHEHDFFELVAVYKGDGFQVIDGIKIPLCQNEIFLIFPGQKHHYEDYSHLSLLTFIFKPAVLTPYMNEFNRLEGFRKLFRKDFTERRLLFIDDLAMSKLDNLVFRITEEQLNMEPGVPVMLTILLVEALMLISRKCFDISADEAVATRKLAPVLSYMENNFHLKLTLKKLAQASGLSVPAFCRLFKNRMNVSPITYLLNLRIKKAKELLASSTLSITEISDRTGFNDANYFSRQFMRLVGSQPHVYRNSDHGFLHIPSLETKEDTKFVL